MKYLLDEEEYQALLNVKAKQEKIDESELQKVCTLAAINTLLPDCWISNHSEPKAWGCILDSKSGMEYCDECPSQKVCPNDWKQWSK